MVSTTKAEVGISQPLDNLSVWPFFSNCFQLYNSIIESVQLYEALNFNPENIVQERWLKLHRLVFVDNIEALLIQLCPIQGLDPVPQTSWIE